MYMTISSCIKSLALCRSPSLNAHQYLIELFKVPIIFSKSAMFVTLNMLPRTSGSLQAIRKGQSYFVKVIEFRPATLTITRLTSLFTFGKFEGICTLASLEDRMALWYSDRWTHFTGHRKSILGLLVHDDLLAYFPVQI